MFEIKAPVGEDLLQTIPLRFVAVLEKTQGLWRDTLALGKRCQSHELPPWCLQSSSWFWSQSRWPACQRLIRPRHAPVKDLVAFAKLTKQERSTRVNFLSSFTPRNPAQSSDSYTQRKLSLSCSKLRPLYTSLYFAPRPRFQSPR